MSYYPASISRCQHIKTNGIQCGSPALHRRRFCFFHNRWREDHAARSAAPLPALSALELPLLEDANSVQIALMQVMRLILKAQIDSKTAGLLLYALQTASLNLRNTNFEPRSRTDVVIDPRDVPLVPLDEGQWHPDDFEDEDEDEDEDEESGDEENEPSEAKADGASQEPKKVDTKAEPVAPLEESSKNPANSRTAAANSSITATASSPNGSPPPRKPRYRWVPPPDYGPLSEKTKADLRMLNEWFEQAAPLPPGETD